MSTPSEHGTLILVEGEQRFSSVVRERNMRIISFGEFCSTHVIELLVV
jgi:hypothetical protein